MESSNGERRLNPSHVTIFRRRMRLMQSETGVGQGGRVPASRRTPFVRSACSVRGSGEARDARPKSYIGRLCGPAAALQMVRQNRRQLRLPASVTPWVAQTSLPSSDRLREVLDAFREQPDSTIRRLAESS